MSLPSAAVFGGRLNERGGGESLAVALEGADIILTRVKGGGWISAAIERATRDDPLITFSHAALVVDGGAVDRALLVEMTWPRGREVPLTYYAAGGAKWLALRSPRRPAFGRQAVVRRGLEYEGRLYPLGKLVLQMADLATGSRFFTRGLGVRYLEVCSGLVARAYKDGAGFYFKDDQTGKTLDPESVRPDDIHDFACRWPHDLQAVAGSVL